MMMQTKIFDFPMVTMPVVKKRQIKKKRKR